MIGLFSAYNLKGRTIRNRIVMPPMVCFGYPEEDGIVTERNVRHYADRSFDGPGIVITEATCVRPDGKAAPRQLGIWSDDHIEGLSRISSTVKGNGALSLIQLHHAGLATPASAYDRPVGPSASPDNPQSRALDTGEVRELGQAFERAALRAKKAGFDGVELHGAHGYLLNQFANSSINLREDEYGGDLQGRLRLAIEVISGIRESCGSDFIVGYRMGANSPTLADGIAIAQLLETTGIDLLHVSHGGNLRNLPRPPKDFQFNWIVFSGKEIRKSLKIPVVVVNEIKTMERAGFLIEQDLADFVAIGRPMLADPFWVHHVKTGHEINLCLSCKPRCRWYENSDLCPAYQRLRKS
jgi:NADPH2 dehydrogenase